MRGRPKKENNRTHMIKIRLLEDEYEILSNLSSKTGKTMSEIIRDAFMKLQSTMDKNDQCFDKK